MQHIPLVDNENITVVYLPEKKIIYHTIHKPTGGTLLRDAVNAGTKALKQYGACKWLSDDRKNGPIPTEDINWGFEDWNRRTIEAGWKYWALVVPADMIAAGSLTNMMIDLSSHNLRMMVFKDLEEAFGWLDQMEG